MIDTPNNCHVQAAFCRAQAANTNLANVRLRHLAAAEAWENLASVLEGDRRRQAPMSRTEAFVPTNPAGPSAPRSLEGWENEGGGLRP